MRPVATFAAAPQCDLRALCAAVSMVSAAYVEEVAMLGEGEGIELIGVFLTFMVGLGVMVLLGKWWEA